MKSGTLKFYDNQVKISHNVFWNDVLQSWIVLDPAVASTVLRSGIFLVNDPAERLSRIAAENSVTIPTILAALRDSPLANNGVEHKRTRRQFAAKLAPRMDAAATSFLHECMERLPQILEPGQSADLFVDLLIPAMNAALPELGGNEILHETFKINSATQLFSSSQIMNGARLKMLDEEMSRAAHNGGAPEKKDIVMSMFAGDPTIGSLGESLIDCLRSNPGLRLCDIQWPEQFCKTSLAFTERVASTESEISGVRIKKGDRVVLYLGAFEAASQLHFGAGAHRCLGEALAKMLWNQLRDAIATRREKLEIEHVEYRAADLVFAMPLSIKVKVTI